MATISNARRTEADTVVLLQQAAGIALIPKPTTLTRLNYFDGKFLRATDLQAEQEYHRRLQQLAASAGGSGVVHGFDLQLLAGDQIDLGAGLALDAEGRVLFLPMDAAVQIEELIRRSAGTTAVMAGGARGSAVFTLCETAAVTQAATPQDGAHLYVLGITHAEALCGQEDVFGKPCESACASGTERPLRLEGVVLRALPLQLATPWPVSGVEPMQTLHMRSRVASAWFADEARQVESRVSGSGLLSSLWCRGAPAATGAFVPLAVIARAGGHTVFLDAWTARRERMDGPPRRHWQWRLRMRPWDVFMAQVLQFQCQLRDAFAGVPAGPDDPCAELRKAVVEVGDILTQLDRQYQAASARLALRDAASPEGGAVPLSRTLLASALQRAGQVRGTLVLQPTDRVLIRRGIVELPSAGYLPVASGSAFPVNEQVRRLMGEGVDLRFCVVRPDFVAHALEEAQHMQRISLLAGLDNPQAREEVDILVPDGQILNAANRPGAGWAVRLTSHSSATRLQTQAVLRDVMTGAARSEQRPDGGLEFFFAGLLETGSRDAALTELKGWAAERDNNLEQTLWKSVELQRAVAAQREAAMPAGEPATGPGGTKGRPAAARKAAAKSAARATVRATAAEPTPQQLQARFTALREESVAYRLKTLQRVALKATTAGIGHFAGLGAKAGGEDSDHTALWLALRSEADPLAAAEGSRVDMGMDLSLISPKSGGTQYVDIGVVGAQFIVESRVTTGPRVVVQGTLRGAAIIAGLVGTLANAQRALQFSVPAIVSREPTDEGSATRVELDFSALLFDGQGFLGIERLGVKVLAADGNRQASVQVQVSAQGTGLNLAARLTRDDTALQLGSPLRAASETAIDVIATRESQANFATGARAELFGQRLPQEDALTLRATLDWVLFHRRRTRQCGTSAAAPVLEQRRYEIHHLKAKTDAQLRAARAAVLGADAATIRRLGFAPIGAATFEGGRSRLATPTAELLQDWAQARPGSGLRFGAIGSQGAAQAEGDALARARLASLEQTLLQGTPDRALENQVLPALPALGLTGWDGAVFLITQDVATVCHDVVGVSSQEMLKRFVDLARRSGLPAAMRELGLALLGHADFEPDGLGIQAASAAQLRMDWGDTAPGPSAVAFVPAGGDQTAAGQRTIEILKALGTGSDDVRAAVVEGFGEVSRCAGLSVLVRAPVEVQSQSVLLGFAFWRSGSFVVNADTPPLLPFTFADFRPQDMNPFVDDFKAFLERQPNGITVATQTPADEADALQIRSTTDGLVQQLGYGGIQVSNVQVLGEAEILAIEARGFPRGRWRFVVFLSQRV